MDLNYLNKRLPGSQAKSRSLLSIKDLENLNLRKAASSNRSIWKIAL